MSSGGAVASICSTSSVARVAGRRLQAACGPPRSPTTARRSGRMSATDELLENARREAAGCDKGDLPLPPSKADTGITPEWAAEAFLVLVVVVCLLFGCFLACLFNPVLFS